MKCTKKDSTSEELDEQKEKEAAYAKKKGFVEVQTFGDGLCAKNVKNATIKELHKREHCAKNHRC